MRRKTAEQPNLAAIIDNIPGFVVALGPSGEVDFVNRQILEYFGKTNEELKNWALTDSIHPDDLPRVIETLAKSIETGQIYEIEHRCRRADGVYRWFQGRGLPVRDTENKITAWYVLLTDIEDRKKAEEALQSSERNLSLMINAIPAIIAVMRADGTPIYGNQEGWDYNGLTMEDMLKEDFRTRVFHPEDMERLRDERRLAFSRPVPFENEIRALRRDGKYRWFLFRYKPLLDEMGKIDRWYMAATDIEDRKRAEAQVEQAYLRLAEAQRLSKTGSFITDLLLDDHNWSEEAFRIFDFDPAAKVTIQMIRDRVHAEDLPFFERVIARGMRGIDVDFVFRIVTSGGTMKHVRGMARVMGLSAGHPLFIGAFQDVTEGKLAEEALNRARSELAHVARVTTLNALTASIAHEVNQPLSGVITNASTFRRMLDADPPNIEGAREAARRAIRDGNRASDVITRLRTLFSKKEFTLEPLDLNEATEEVIAMSLSDLQRNRVILRSELAKDLPPVIGDRVQLQQVILNLLRNASDAMIFVEDRPRELLIRTERDEGDQVRLTVTDVGAGLTTENADKLFEAFYTTKKDGMGIGLSVSRSIIEAHKGRLWATPNDGPGATFQFTLPAEANASATSAGG
jgi:PAS domain S-box-containing protein